MSPPLPYFASTEIMHVTVCATHIKYKVLHIILPLIGIKKELEEEKEKKNVALPLKKRRVCKVYKKQICKQRAGEINSLERVTHIELQPYNPLLHCLQYKY